MSRKGSSLLGLRDKLPAAATAAPSPATPSSKIEQPSNANNRPPVRQGRKQIAGFFSNEMSLAMRTTAMRNGMTLQQGMAEAFNDWLRKYGESPIGD